jgi:hypothetical protein
MFRWASAQPLPPRLAELMERAGALRVDWFERSPSDVLVFLPPHLVLSSGRLPLAGIQTSYRLLLEANATGVLLNGERLLNLSAADLAAWQPGEPLPRACPVNPPAPLEAALTLALLAADPGLAAAYRDLDARAERGGAPADDDYGARLRCNDAPGLVDHWNQQLERRQAEAGSGPPAPATAGGGTGVRTPVSGLPGGRPTRCAGNGASANRPATSCSVTAR